MARTGNSTALSANPNLYCFTIMAMLVILWKPAPFLDGDINLLPLCLHDWRDAKQWFLGAYGIERLYERLE